MNRCVMKLATVGMHVEPSAYRELSMARAQLGVHEWSLYHVIVGDGKRGQHFCCNASFKTPSL
jgi:hypothetical protein